MRRRFGIVITLTLLCPLAIHAQLKLEKSGRAAPPGRALPPELAAAVATGEFIDVNPAAFLARVARECNRPIGFEVADAVEADSRITITGIPETIDDVLDTFIRADPRYTWTENEGVINVVPIRARAVFLDTRVLRFRVSASWGDEIVNALIGTVEVRQAAERLGVAARIPIITVGSGQRPERDQVLLEVENGTMQAILNAAVVKIGASFWVFQIYGEHRQYYTLVIW